MKPLSPYSTPWEQVAASLADAAVEAAAALVDALVVIADSTLILVELADSTGLFHFQFPFMEEEEC